MSLLSEDLAEDHRRGRPASPGVAMPGVSESDSGDGEAGGSDAVPGDGGGSGRGWAGHEEAFDAGSEPAEGDHGEGDGTPHGAGYFQTGGTAATHCDRGF